MTSGDIVSFVNALGRDATLIVGNYTTPIGDKSSVPIKFRDSGEALAVEMDPQCTLDVATHQQMTVYVAAAAVTTVATPKTDAPATAALATHSQTKATAGHPQAPVTPTAKATITESPEYIGGSTVNTDALRDLLSLILIVSTIVAAAVVLTAIAVVRRFGFWSRRTSGGGDGAPQGSHEIVPEGYSAKIYDLGRRAAERQKTS